MFAYLRFYDDGQNLLKRGGELTASRSTTLGDASRTSECRPPGKWNGRRNRPRWKRRATGESPESSRTGDDDVLTSSRDPMYTIVCGTSVGPRENHTGVKCDRKGRYTHTPTFRISDENTISRDNFIYSPIWFFPRSDTVIYGYFNYVFMCW